MAKGGNRLLNLRQAKARLIWCGRLNGMIWRGRELENVSNKCLVFRLEWGRWVLVLCFSLFLECGWQTLLWITINLFACR